MSGDDGKPQKAQITFGKFDNVDLRAAKVISAPLAEGTKSPCRVITLDVGHLGTKTSIGQYALIDEDDLVGKNVVVCVNLGQREMGPYISELLVLGTHHPESPADQSQAVPLLASDSALPGDSVF
jgi:tRNA-binding protein